MSWLAPSPVSTPSWICSCTIAGAGVGRSSVDAIQCVGLDAPEHTAEVFQLDSLLRTARVATFDCGSGWTLNVFFQLPPNRFIE